METGHQQFNSYELAYQDKEGDWLLAEDVPWRQVLIKTLLSLIYFQTSSIKPF